MKDYPQDPKSIAKRMLQVAQLTSQDALEEMTSEEKLEFTREFVQVMAEWQPAVKNLLEQQDPVKASLSCLGLAMMFVEGWAPVYVETHKRVDAYAAIEKAFEGFKD